MGACNSVKKWATAQSMAEELYGSRSEHCKGSLSRFVHDRVRSKSEAAVDKGDNPLRYPSMRYPLRAMLSHRVRATSLVMGTDGISSNCTYAGPKNRCAPATLQNDLVMRVSRRTRSNR
jgi:hypothetical protein